MTIAPVSAGNRRARDGGQQRIASGPVELRELADGRVEFSGYAAVFGERSQGLPFVEVIDPGAFRDCLTQGPDVALVLQHNPDTVIARTTAGNLTLTEDARGLRVVATLNPEDPDAARAIVKLRDGNWRSMSFRFWDLTPGDDGTVVAADGTVERHVTRADIDFGDVSIVTYPAYAGTVAELRGRLRDALGSVAITAGEERGVLRGLIEDLGPNSVLLEAELDRRAAQTRAAGLTVDDLWIRVHRGLDQLLPSESWDFGWWMRDVADDWVVVRAYGNDPDSPISDGFWQFPYTIDGAGTCTFGDPIEVLPRTVYDPVPDPETTRSGDSPSTMTLEQARQAARPVTHKGARA